MIPPYDENAPLLLYFDIHNRLQVGTWDVQALSGNIAFFTFGGVIGFINHNDGWNSGDIRFNPTTTPNSTWEASATAYKTLPAWGNWTGSRPGNYSISTNLDFISSDRYHYRANVQSGRGDPCRLVGYTVDEIRSWTDETFPATATYRLPTVPENTAFVGYPGVPPVEVNVYSSYPVSVSNTTPKVATYKNGNSLPCLGWIDDSTPYNWNVTGCYWSSTPAGADAPNLHFGISQGVNTNLPCDNTSTVTEARSVRCVYDPQ